MACATSEIDHRQVSTLRAADEWDAFVQNNLDVWRIASEQQRASKQVKIGEDEEHEEPKSRRRRRRRRRRSTKIDAKVDRKALFFDYDVFCRRKKRHPSLHFQDWLVEEQEAYVEVYGDGWGVSTERTLSLVDDAR